MGNNSAIEKSAVNSVETALLETGYVDTFINTGDKEPIWDGNIYIYQDNNHKDNEHLHGRIPIQVKGTEVKIENSLKYNVSVSHLKPYLEDGGVLYFVVQVDLQHTVNNKIFYCNLDPFHIKQYLLKKNKAKVQVDIKPLPKDHKEIVEVLYNFYEDLKTQKKYSLSDTTPKLDIGKFVIPLATPFKDRTNRDVLFHVSRMCYVSDFNGGLYPIMEIDKDEVVCVEEIIGSVSVNKKIYYTNYQNRVTNHSRKLYLDDDKIIFDLSKQKSGHIKITAGGKISKCINRWSFILDIARHNSVTIGDKKYNLGIIDADLEDITLRHNNLIKLDTALKKSLACRELELAEDLSQYDEDNIITFMAVFVDNKKLNLHMDGESYFLKFEICNQKILAVATRETDGFYKVDSYSADIPASVGDKKVSPYLILKKEYLINVLNIDFENILPDIKKYPVDYKYLTIVNNFVLQLLLAYDESKEVILLKTAKEVMSWVIEQNKDKKSETPYKLNLLQCKYREGTPFNEEDSDYLHHILESDSDSACKFGAYVLLKDPYAAKHFDKLNARIQENIMMMPIYNLWKELNNG